MLNFAYVGSFSFYRLARGQALWESPYRVSSFHLAAVQLIYRHDRMSEGTTLNDARVGNMDSFDDLGGQECLQAELHGLPQPTLTETTPDVIST